MAQLQEDEWPRDGEPTTTEKEQQSRTPPVGKAGRPEDRERTGAYEPSVPVTNTEPDEAVD